MSKQFIVVHMVDAEQGQINASRIRNYAASVHMVDGDGAELRFHQPIIPYMLRALKENGVATYGVRPWHGKKREHAIALVGLIPGNVPHKPNKADPLDPSSFALKCRVPFADWQSLCEGHLPGSDEFTRFNCISHKGPSNDGFDATRVIMM